MTRIPEPLKYFKLVHRILTRYYVLKPKNTTIYSEFIGQKTESKVGKLITGESNIVITVLLKSTKNEGFAKRKKEIMRLQSLATITSLMTRITSNSDLICVQENSMPIQILGLA